MNTRTPLACALVAAALLQLSPGSLSAQVVEGRESEANPAAAIFRATLYGAGTGLALAGAYALVADGDTGDILRWGVAGGAAAGAIIGVIYVATRSEPEGSVDEVDTDDIGMLRLERGSLEVAAPTLRARERVDLLGRRLTSTEAKLFEVVF